MGQISLQIPQTGLPNSTEDPKVASDLTIVENVINGNVDLSNLSAALQAIVPGAWTTYTPAWTGATGNPTLGNGTLKAAYQTFNHTCALSIYLSVPTSWTGSGGLGALQFSLPVQASSAGGEQYTSAKILIPQISGNVLGLGYIPAGATVMNVLFPISPGNGISNFWQNADASGAAGTGIPATNASYTWTAAQGGNLGISGVYRTV